MINLRCFQIKLDYYLVMLFNLNGLSYMFYRYSCAYELLRYDEGQIQHRGYINNKKKKGPYFADVTKLTATLVNINLVLRAIDDMLHLEPCPFYKTQYNVSGGERVCVLSCIFNRQKVLYCSIFMYYQSNKKLFIFFNQE